MCPWRSFGCGVLLCVCLCVCVCVCVCVSGLFTRLEQLCSHDLREEPHLGNTTERVTSLSPRRKRAVENTTPSSEASAEGLTELSDTVLDEPSHEPSMSLVQHQIKNSSSILVVGIEEWCRSEEPHV